MPLDFDTRIIPSECLPPPRWNSLDESDESVPRVIGQAAQRLAAIRGCRSRRDEPSVGRIRFGRSREGRRQTAATRSRMPKSGGRSGDGDLLDEGCKAGEHTASIIPVETRRVYGLDTLFPCELTYCIDFEVEASFKCAFGPALAYALDRFRADEVRFSVGLMAVLTTSGAGTVFIGSCSRKGAAYLGYATQVETVSAKPGFPRGRSVAGGEASAGFAEFHLFYPDCPAYVSEYATMQWPRARGLVLEFAERGAWPSEVEWFDR